MIKTLTTPIAAVAHAVAVGPCADGVSPAQTAEQDQDQDDQKKDAERGHDFLAPSGDGAVSAVGWTLILLHAS